VGVKSIHGDATPVLSIILLHINYGLPTFAHRKALLNPNCVETEIGISSYENDGGIFIV